MFFVLFLYYYILLHLKYNLFTGLRVYGNLDHGLLPALQLLLSLTKPSQFLCPSLLERDTYVFVYYCLNHAYFHCWCSTRGIKVGNKTVVHTQASDILGSPFRVIKVPERWMREESVRSQTISGIKKKGAGETWIRLYGKGRV